MNLKDGTKSKKTGCKCKASESGKHKASEEKDANESEEDKENDEPNEPPSGGEGGAHIVSLTQPSKSGDGATTGTEGSQEQLKASLRLTI